MASRQSEQYMLMWMLFVLAYLFLLPGLFLTAFSGKVSFLGFTMFVMEKSIIGGIRHLIGQGSWLSAFMIFLFAVMIPFTKMFVLIAYGYCAHVRGQGTRLGNSMGDAVMYVHYGALIDAFAAGTIVLFLAARHLLHEEIQKVEVRAGLFCFLGYSILSVCGDLLLDPKASPPAKRIPIITSPATNKRRINEDPEELKGKQKKK